MKVFISRNKLKIVAITALFLIWEILACLIDRHIILPSPSVTFQSLLDIVTGPNFIIIMRNTIVRSIISFLLTFVLALTLGIWAGFKKSVYEFLNPVILVDQAIPTISIILLAIIWLQPERAPILVGGIMIFPLLYLNVVEGVRSIDPKLIEMVHLYKVNRWIVLRKLYLPSIRKYIMAGSLAASSLNLKVVVAAEVFSQPRLSIGTSFQIARVNLNTPELFAWTLIVIFLTAIFDQIIKFIFRNQELPT